MLDAQQIAEMDGPQKLEALVSLMERAMPGATIQAIADRLGVQRRAIHQWKAKPTSIPTMALMLLEAWADQKDATGQQRALQGVLEAMEQLADRFGDLAREMQP